MPTTLRTRCLMFLFALLLFGSLAAGRSVAQSDAALGGGEETVPYGAASGWLVGHQLLIEGKPAEALPYLHVAYRADPDAPAVALDFQQALLAEGYLRDALNVAIRLVESYPDSIDYRLLRSSLFAETGDTKKALEDLRHLRQQGHASLAILTAEASILAEDGQIVQALDVLRDGIHLHPAAAANLFMEMARLLQDADRVDEIPSLMDEALTTFPEVPGLWLFKIRALAGVARDDEALAAARLAEAMFGEERTSSETPGMESLEEAPDTFAPNRPHVPEAPESFLVELANFYAQQRQLNRAMAVLEPLAATGELGLRPSLWLARLLLGTGRTEEGAGLVAEILDRWPTASRGWFLKGKTIEADGDWPEALSVYAKAVDLSPYDPEIRLAHMRAMLVAWEGDLSAREPDADQIAKLGQLRKNVAATAGLVPEQDTDGQLILGYACRTIGDHREASEHFVAAAVDPDLRLGAMVQQSICLDDLGLDGSARAVLEQLRREYPDNPEVANSLGYFLAEKATDLDLAFELVEEALDAEPGNGAYLDSLGWVLYRQGELEEALDHLIQAVNVMPEDPVILEHLGVVLKDVGRPTEALDVLRRSLAMGGDPERLRPLMNELESQATDDP